MISEVLRQTEADRAKLDAVIYHAKQELRVRYAFKILFLTMRRN